MYLFFILSSFFAIVSRTVTEKNPNIHVRVRSHFAADYEGTTTTDPT